MLGADDWGYSIHIALMEDAAMVGPPPDCIEDQITWFEWKDRLVAAEVELRGDACAGSAA